MIIPQQRIVSKATPTVHKAQRSSIMAFVTLGYFERMFGGVLVVKGRFPF